MEAKTEKPASIETQVAKWSATDAASEVATKEMHALINRMEAK